MEKQVGQVTKTAQHSVIYAIGTMLSRLTGLIMLPIYTRYLIPADYGALALFTLAIELMGILVGIRISQAMFRFYILEEDAAQKKVIVSTVLFTAFISSVIGAVILFFSSSYLSTILFGNSEYEYEFQLFAFTLITNAVSSVGLSYIRARRKPVFFVCVSITTLALQVALNVYFIVLLNMHVEGVVLSSLISGSIVAIFLAIHVLWGTGFCYSKKMAMKLVHYVSPLILASLGTFFVAYADKYFIRLYSNLTEVGLYALAAKVSSILGTINLSFNMAWMADRFEIVKKDNALEIYGQVFRFFSAILIISGVGLSIFSNDLLRIMTDPEFYSAGNVVCLLVLAAVLQSFTTFCNFGIMLEKQTRYMAQASWYKAAVSLASCLILIPYIGLYGAALALVVSNLFELYWVNMRARNLYDMQLKWSPVVLMFALASICTILAFMLPLDSLFYFLVRVSFFIVFVLVVYFMPFWHHEDRVLMKSLIHKALRVKG
jgi:O-antigen/teichoic acid export membrane protein